LILPNYIFSVNTEKSFKRHFKKSDLLDYRSDLGFILYLYGNDELYQKPKQGFPDLHGVKSMNKEAHYGFPAVP